MDSWLSQGDYPRTEFDRGSFCLFSLKITKAPPALLFSICFSFNYYLNNSLSIYLTDCKSPHVTDRISIYLSIYLSSGVNVT